MHGFDQMLLCLSVVAQLWQALGVGRPSIQAKSSMDTEDVRALREQLQSISVDMDSEALSSEHDMQHH